jgi:hypothetical protein
VKPTPHARKTPGVIAQYLDADAKPPLNARSMDPELGLFTSPD